jgi:hypothetical protein
VEDVEEGGVTGRSHMPTSLQKQKQKGAETRILEAARRACKDIPEGDIVPFEEPDLKLITDAGVLGVEVTQLVRPPEENGFEPVKTESFHKEVVRLAEQYYRTSDSPVPDVGVYFLDEQRAELENPSGWRWLMDKSSGRKAEKMARSLSDFVKTHYPSETEVVTYSRRDQLPVGIEVLTIASPLRRHWYSGESGSMGPLTYDHLASTIKTKNDLLPKYQANLPGCPIWLLIYSGPSIAEGVPIPRMDGWTFNFSFDKVLLFSGMDNRVFQIY